MSFVMKTPKMTSTVSCKCEATTPMDKYCEFCAAPIDTRKPGTPPELEIVRVLYTAPQIKERVQQLATRIDGVHECSDGKGVVLMGVLTGAYVFLSDLSRAMTTPHTIEFVRSSSYKGGTESTGTVDLTGLPPRESLDGKHVVIVEDILDTGRTFARIRDALKDWCEPASVEFCALLSKPKAQVVEDLEVRREFIGFEMDPPEFVVGFGLDYKGHFRGLPYIAVARVKE
jgi:hypoxanthine phosphoribosyltransferase